MKIFRRVVKYFVVGLLLSLSVGELVAWCVCGLGDPPLSEGAADIDYIFKPNQDCRRFGNRICYNSCSMRMREELDVRPRIFVVGDSVVNGGSLTDQKDIATEVLQSRHPDWQVCNVSAGSWGPGNYAAYFRRHPNLVREGDVLVLVMSTHDLWEDDPREGGGRIVGRDPSFPSQRPVCALWDGIQRYFLPRCRRYFPATLLKFVGGSSCVSANVKVDVVPSHGRAELETFNLAAIDELYRLPFSRKFMIHYPSREETIKNIVLPKELGVVYDQAERNGVSVVPFQMAVENYRDTIHPDVEGQKKLADEIERIVFGGGTEEVL